MKEEITKGLGKKKEKIGLIARTYKSFRTALALVLIFAMMTPLLVVSFYSEVSLRQTLYETTSAQMDTILQDKYEYLEEYFKDGAMNLDKIVKELGFKASMENKEEEYVKIIEKIRVAVQGNSDILNFGLYTPDGKFTLINSEGITRDFQDKITEQEWYIDAVNAKGETVIENTNDITYTNKAIIINGEIETIASLQISNKKVIDGIGTTPIGANSNILLVGTDGTLLTAPDKSYLGLELGSTKPGYEKVLTEAKAEPGKVFREDLDDNGKIYSKAIYHEASDFTINATAYYDEVPFYAPNFKKILISINVIGFIVSVIISYFIANFVTRKLLKGAKVIETAGTGDLTARWEGEKQIEFKDFSNEVNNTLSLIANSLKEIKLSTVESDVLSKTLEQQVHKTKDFAVTLITSMEEIAKGNDEGVQSIQQVVDSLSELSNKVTLLTESMQSVKEQGLSILDISKEGLKSVEVLDEKAQHGKQSAEELNIAMKELSDNVDKIQEILKSIVSISEQTNLLSLNAAIEAARAGEAGKGFAVVADEVRKLSDDSKKMTGQITEILGRVRNSTEQALDVAHKSIDNSESQFESVNEAKKVFLEMNASISENATVVGESLEILKEVRNVKESVLTEIETMSAMVEETSSSSQESSENSKRILDVMNELEKVVANNIETSRRVNKNIDKFKI